MQAGSDVTAGTAAAVAGFAGITIQWMTQFTNLLAAGANLTLAIGGLYLLWMRISRAHRDRRRDP